MSVRRSVKVALLPALDTDLHVQYVRKLEYAMLLLTH